MSIESKLISGIKDAVRSLYGQEVPESVIQLSATKKDFEGHLTLVVFPFLKISRKRPEDTAQEIGQYLVENLPDVVARFNVIKGFLNMVIADAQWLSLLADIQSEPKYGLTEPKEDSPLVMIEYSSPNTNKPLHLGHVRNNLLGWALAQIMAANGNRVVKTNIVNDRGIHICKSMLAWLRWGNGETPESSGKKGDHLPASPCISISNASHHLNLFFCFHSISAIPNDTTNRTHAHCIGVKGKSSSII